MKFCRPICYLLVIAVVFPLLKAADAPLCDVGVPQNIRIGDAAPHYFTGLPLTMEGWTDFEAMVGSGEYSSSRVVFVSISSGDDGTGQPHDISSITFDTDGMFQSIGTIHPYHTLDAAYEQIRDGYADILLLKRGDSWSSIFTGYVKSGASQTAPHIIASYGSGNRPQIMDCEFNSSNQNYVIVSGLKFYSFDWTTADRALDIRGTASYQTFEDLYIEQKSGDIVQGSSVNNIAFRRCIWTHNEAHDGQLYAQDASNILLEENIFHEPYDDSFTDNSRYGRHLYFTHGDLNGVIVRGNIFYGSDREGVDLRAGGDAYENLIVQSYLRVGDAGTGTRYTASANIYNNVLTEGSPRTGTATIILILANNGSNIYNNIVTDSNNCTVNTIGISIIGNYSSTPPLPIAKNLDIYNNLIFGWAASGGVGYGLKFDSNISDISNISIHDNQLQMVNGHGFGAILGYPTALFSHVMFADNDYYSTEAEADWFYQGNLSSWVSSSGETGASSAKITYTDPNRTVGSYYQTIGGLNGTDAFMTATLNQARHNWNSDLTANPVINYIRAGFDKEAVGYSYASP